MSQAQESVIRRKIAGPGLSETRTEEPGGAGFETAEDPRIPRAQRYFKIGEVVRIVGVPAYVLRYWETEFPGVRPEKTSTKQRRYRRQDVALLLKIRRLRHDEQLPIEKARRLLKDGCESAPKESRTEALASALRLRAVDAERRRAALNELRAIAQELLDLVNDDVDCAGRTARG